MVEEGKALQNFGWLPKKHATESWNILLFLLTNLKTAHIYESYCNKIKFDLLTYR